MSFLPGLGIAKGMALTLLRFFQPKVTIMYPEVPAEGSPKFRGRLQLLYDEWGTLKCETCFQCAQACPIECIDMGGVDTKGRYHIHWGAAETYGERRDESALRRAGRPVPDEAYEHFGAIDLAEVDEILVRHDFDPKEMLQILEETQEAYGYVPVAALKRISFSTGAWYAMLYGTATYYRHLRLDPPIESVAVCRCTSCLMSGAGRIQDALERALDTRMGLPAAPGRIRLEQVPSHLPGTASPLVIVGGAVQRVAPEGLDAWAAGLAGRTGTNAPGARTQA